MRCNCIRNFMKFSTNVKAKTKFLFSLLAGTKTFIVYDVCESVSAWYSLSKTVLWVKPDRGSVCGRVLKRMYVQERETERLCVPDKMCQV